MLSGRGGSVRFYLLIYSANEMQKPGRPWATTTKAHKINETETLNASELTTWLFALVACYNDGHFWHFNLVVTVRRLGT